MGDQIAVYAALAGYTVTCTDINREIIPVRHGHSLLRGYIAIVHALGHPMGPFRLMDLTGIDLTYHAGIERYQETRDPRYKPSPIIVKST